MSKRDYYEVLGVPRDASDQDIKRAYRQLALKYHPDRNPGNTQAEENFKQASEAYAVLADAEKRARYDRFGHAGVGGAAAGPGFGFDPTIFGDFSDILGDFFGVSFGDLFGGGQRPRRGGARRGADLRYDLEITFEEAARGTETKIQIPRLDACDTCKGSGAKPGTARATCPACHGRGQLRYQQGFLSVSRTCPQCYGAGQVIKSPCEKCTGEGRVHRERKLTIKIPPGVDTGSRIRLMGEGEAGVAAGPPGDLYVIVQVQDHPVFRRDGDDLFCTVPITFPQAALGAEIAVPTLDGPEKARVGEGTQSGTTLRLRGKGMPNVSGGGRGDLYVKLAVATPRKLTKEQRRLLEELAQHLSAPEPLPRESDEDDRTFFNRVKDIFG